MNEVLTRQDIRKPSQRPQEPIMAPDDILIFEDVSEGEIRSITAQDFLDSLGLSNIENTNNKISSWGTPTNTQYPSAKLAKDTLDTKEDKSNKTLVVDKNSVDTQYPSAKAVYTAMNEFLSHSAGATLTPATNQIAMSGIVSALGLEVGDVIQIIGGGDNDGRLHTVEDIEDNDSIVVNYEHCGNRGDGSLKLFSYSGNLVIKLIAKWWQAPIGLGQAWVSRASTATKTNTTNRTIAIHVRARLKYPGMSAIVDGTQMVKKDSANAGSEYDQNDWVFVPAGSTYSGNIIREFR